MKTFLLLAFAASFSLGAHAEDTSYSGGLVSASKKVSVRYPDGHIVAFDISRFEQGQIENGAYTKTATLSSPSTKNGSCSKMIGELASDLTLTLKTDENELATVNFKASTPEAHVRLAGDCDGGISGDLTLYNDPYTPMDVKAVMSTEPAGPPGKNASYYGTVQNSSPQVSIRAEDGSVREYSVSNLKVGQINNRYKMIEMTVNGASSMCGDSMGTLAKDFFLTVRTPKGMVRTALVHAAPAGAKDQVMVYGECHGSGLSQLQLGAPSEGLFEIQ